MAQSGVFAWTEVHQESWACLKMLACLGFETHVLDPTRPLYYTCDSSQISCAFTAYQISPEGEILLIATDCRIFKLADRHNPAAMRELLALMFCLMSNEHEIRAHKSHILVLTDCISLGMLLRMKDSSSKMLEIAL